MIFTYSLDVLLVLLSAFLFIAILRIDRFVTWVIGVYLFVYSVPVITVEVRSLFSLLNSRMFFLFFHWSLLLVIALIWWGRGYPDPFLPFRQLNNNFRAYLSSLHLSWDIWVAGMFCIGGFLFIGYSNLMILQSIDDVLTAASCTRGLLVAAWKSGSMAGRYLSDVANHISV